FENHQRKEILPEWISLWASKDDDKLIRRSLKLIHKVIEEDPDDFFNHNKELLLRYGKKELIKCPYKKEKN
ncbi:hypothetical protein H5410_024784, partial [Solanum commersonii]